MTDRAEQMRTYPRWVMLLIIFIAILLVLVPIYFMEGTESLFSMLGHVAIAVGAFVLGAIAMIFLIG